MKKHEEIIAKKYAVAFLNCYQKDLSLHDYCALSKISVNIKKSSPLLTLLDVSFISLKTKTDALSSLMQEYSLPSVIEPLLRLLLHHHRLSLFPLVVQFLITVYSQRNSLLPVTIRASLPLSAQQVEIFKGFLSRQTQCHIIVTTIVDVSLIAGIRMESLSHLWEHSIAKQLRQISQINHRAIV